MRLLALDAALASCSVAVLDAGVVRAERQAHGERGQAAVLAEMVRVVLAGSGLAAASFDAVAVTIGPGSFTGLRAALSLAHGFAQAIARPVVGVTVAEALAAALPPDPSRTVWTAIDSRRGRVFIDDGDTIAAFELAALPPARGRVAVTGDAAIAVASRLAARGGDVALTCARLPHARHVAAVAALRLAGRLPMLAAQPLYIDPPEAKLPSGGLRPPPRGTTLLS